MASQPVYDVIVVGSGAAGGIVAYVLATRGLKVLCLEAGRMLDPAKDFYTHKFPYEWPYRGAGKPGEYGHLLREWSGKSRSGPTTSIPFPMRIPMLWPPERNSPGPGCGPWAAERTSGEIGR